MELYSLTVNLRYLLNVLAVVATHHDVGDSGALGSEYLLLDAAYRQYLAAQRYLTGHSCVLAYLTLCKS